MEETTPKHIKPKQAVLCILMAAALLLTGVGIGYGLQPKEAAPAWEGYAPEPAYFDYTDASGEAWEIYGK